MHFLHAINSDRQTRLLNVFGQIEMFWEIKSNFTKLISEYIKTASRDSSNLNDS